MPLASRPESSPTSKASTPSRSPRTGYKDFTQELDFTTSKLKKGQLASIKVSLPPITAVEYYNDGAKALRRRTSSAPTAQLELAIAADPKLTPGPTASWR